MLKASDLTFGIEVECYIPIAKWKQQTGNYHNGIQVDKAPAGWNAQRDGSLCNRPANHTAVEIVSPVLKAEQGLFQVWAVLDLLKELNAVVNTDCGLHVHVGKKGQFSQQEVLEIVNVFTQYEMSFFAVNGDQARARYSNRYCKPSRFWTQNSVFSDRYQSINLTNVGRRKGTVEFRLFAGSTDPKQVLTAVYMAVGMVASCLNGTYRTVEPTITTPTAHEHVYRFVRSIFSKPENRIIHDAPIKDIFGQMVTQAARANF